MQNLPKDNPKRRVSPNSKDSKEAQQERNDILAALNDLEQTKGWEIVKKWASERTQFAYLGLYRDGKDAHDKNVGFLDGLTWIFNKIDSFKKKK